MRLIDTNEVKLQVGFFEKVDNVPKFYDWLNSLPTIDAVEVVRCKDCRHYHKAIFSYCEVNGGIWFADDFCSWAERRTDEA